MSETENNAQHQKQKTSKLAIASVLLGILGIFILVSRAMFYLPWWNDFVGRNVIGLSGTIGLILGMVVLARISRRMAAMISLVVLCPFLLVSFSILMGSRLLFGYIFFASLACLVGLLIGGAVIHWMSRSIGKFGGNGFAILGIVLTTFLCGFWWVETCGPVSTALGMACSNNLSRLGKAMLIYSNDNQGRYPESDQWCDLLLEYNQVELKHFLCPGITFRWRRQVLPWPVPRNERCYYAMNPNCEPDLPADTVLLFETKGGWNRFGGPEILTTENHVVRRCNVMFNDGRVEFVETERIVELKWGVRKNNSNE